MLKLFPSKLASFVLATTLLCGEPGGASAEAIRTGGTGAATETLRRLGEAFAKAELGSEFEVVPSLGSTGGIMAVADGVLHFSVSGRRLKPEEKAKGLTELHLLRSPFGLATSAKAPQSLKSTEAADFYASEKSVWTSGSPVRVVLRPRSESDTAVLGAMLPGMAAAIEKVRTRPDVPLAATDQDNADAAERIPGSLIGATLTQILMEKRKLSFVPIDGFELTIENFASGSYPYGKTITFVFPAQKSATVERFLAFLRSPEGLDVLRQTGNLPVAP